MLQSHPASWPQLREDLTLHAGPSDGSGAPTWTLHDPARNQYFSLDWLSFEVISRLSLGSVEEIVLSIQQETTLHIGTEEVESVLKFLDLNELVQKHDFGAGAGFLKKHQARQTGWTQKLLHGYLFFRIPLFRPDKLLQKLLPHAQIFYSAFFLKLTILVFVLGLWGVYRQWAVFQATLVDTFSLNGLLGYGVALIGIKVIHEMGHAITAKRCGCRVPTMGVAFLVMWPMAYTDVTESWKLNSNRKRLLIAGAGIATELIVAAWMLLAWVILPDGDLRGVTFFLATTSIVATLAINASPLMRFDGYFLLCDVLGKPNLHPRTFAYARWWLREQLFSLGDEPPENLTRNWHRFYILFAFAVWIYRLVVFFGIALLVYHYFFKALGIILFAIEIWYFIARPIWGEIKVWRERWGEIGPVVKHQPAFYIFMLVIGFLLIPFDLTVNSQGMLKPEHSLDIVAYQPSQVEKLPPELGTRVEKGAPLIVLRSPDLLQKIHSSKIKVSALEKQYLTAGFSADTLRQQSVFKEQLDAATAELKGFLAERERLHPTAPYDGLIIDVEPDLFVGEWIPKGMSLVRVIDDKHWVVDTYVEESDLRRLDNGNWGWFVPEAAGLPDVWLSIISIDRDASHILSDGPLGSVAGGQILVRPQNNKLYPERSVYRVRLQASSTDKIISTGHLRGRVVILAWPKSILGDLIRGLLATMMRESGF